MWIGFLLSYAFYLRIYTKVDKINEDVNTQAWLVHEMKLRIKEK